MAAIRADGGLFTWGDNTYGQLGNNATVSRSSPTQIGTSKWSAVWQQGTSVMYATRADGTLWGWGAGPLGDNTTVTRSSPVQIGTSSWTQVTGFGRGNARAGIRADGTLWAWGSAGGIGLGSTAGTYTSPVQVGTGSSWTKIGYGGQEPYSALLDSSGGLYVLAAPWNMTLTTAEAAAIFPAPNTSTYQSWTAISNNLSTAVGIRSDGTLWTWGGNNLGQLGNGSTMPNASPVQLGSDTNWIKVYASSQTSAAIKSDNTLWMWGRNNFGQLGQNNTVNRSSPVQVGGSWSDVVLNANGTIALGTDGSLYTWGSGV